MSSALRGRWLIRRAEYRLLVPYQTPFLSSPPHNYTLAMGPSCSSYIVLFNPQGAPGPTILTTAQSFNMDHKRLRQGSTVTPYPDPANIYRRLAISDPGDNMFEDVYLRDM